MRFTLRSRSKTIVEKMKIRLKLEVSETSKTVFVDTSDYVSESEWNEMSEDLQLEKLQEWADDFDQPYWHAISLREDKD